MPPDQPPDRPPGRPPDGPRERLHRPTPERTEPLRDFSQWFRRPRPSASTRPPGEAGERAPGNWQEAVGEGVEMGYRVIEEHIRQGQRTAQKINERSYGAAAVGDDLRELTERTFRYYSDLAAFWLDLLGRVPDGLDLGRAAAGDGAGVEAAVPPPVVVEVASVRPARVRLELRPGADRLALATRGLHAFEAEVPPITDLAFEAEEGGETVLRLRVPDDQPAGVYSGVVIDHRTGQPAGTLSVVVRE